MIKDYNYKYSQVVTSLIDNGIEPEQAEKCANDIMDIFSGDIRYGFDEAPEGDLTTIAKVRNLPEGKLLVEGLKTLKGKFSIPAGPQTFPRSKEMVTGEPEFVTTSSDGRGGFDIDRKFSSAALMASMRILTPSMPALIRNIHIPPLTEEEKRELKEVHHLSVPVPKFEIPEEQAKQIVEAFHEKHPNLKTFAETMLDAKLQPYQVEMLDQLDKMNTGTKLCLPFMRSLRAPGKSVFEMNQKMSRLFKEGKVKIDYISIDEAKDNE